MGKLAKQRRFQQRKDRLRIAQLEGVAASQRAKLDHANSVAEFQGRDARHARDQLARIVEELQRIASASTCLPVDTKIPATVTRCAVSAYERPHLRALLDATPYSMSDRMTEEIMHVILTDTELRQDLTRTLHFRVLNAPGHRNFAFAYGVTHHAVRCYREPHHLMEIIARQFGQAIHRELFGKERE